MKKILLKYKKILVILVLAITISSIYFIFFNDKKISYICLGKSFSGKDDDYEFWIFDTKNNLAYQRSLTTAPLLYENYSDMYRFYKSNEVMSLEYRFYKVPELLTIRARTKNNSNFDRTISLKCQKKS